MKHTFRITCEITFFYQTEEGGHNGFSASSHHTRKSNSFDTGTALMHAPCSCCPCCCLFLFFLHHPLHFPPPPHTVSVSPFPSGMDRGTPADLDRSSDRRVPVNKPRFPQYRNRSLDCPAGTRCMYLFHLPRTCKATPHSPHSILQHAFCRSV